MLQFFLYPELGVPFFLAPEISLENEILWSPGETLNVPGVAPSLSILQTVVHALERRGNHREMPWTPMEMPRLRKRRCFHCRDPDS